MNLSIQGFPTFILLLPIKCCNLMCSFIIFKHILKSSTECYDLLFNSLLQIKTFYIFSFFSSQERKMKGLGPWKVLKCKAMRIYTLTKKKISWNKSNKVTLNYWYLVNTTDIFGYIGPTAPMTNKPLRSQISLTWE